MATALVAGLLGLFGTIVGAVLTTSATRQANDRSDRRAREERLRQEYRSAVTRFAAALGAYRVAEMDLWHALRGGRKDKTTAAADVYRTRTATWDAFYELELSTDNGDLVQQARRALDSASNIWRQDSEPDSQAEMDRRANQVREDLAEMIATARVSQPG